MNKGKDWVVQTHKVHNLLFDCFDSSKQVEPVAKLLLEKWDLKKKKTKPNIFSASLFGGFWNIKLISGLKQWPLSPGVLWMCIPGIPWSSV